ncbi:MAG: hypothetical protein SWK76_14195 [Actinomycetota bacterium]|nr:hypothetical protein [Actinomycetota bacterium]
MNKIVTILTVMLMLVLLLAGCGGGEEAEQPSPGMRISTSDACLAIPPSPSSC